MNTHYENIKKMTEFYKQFSILTLIIPLFFATGCSNADLENENTKLSTEINSLNKEIEECSKELALIKNTPEQRKLRAQKYFSEDNFKESIIEYEGIIENYNGTEEVIQAEKEINKIKKIIEDRIKEKERKKTLGYKILESNMKPKFDKLSLNFSSITKGQTWSFDSHGDEYRYRSAQRGYTYVLAKVAISSESNNPDLPPILIYKMEEGELKLVGRMGYEFRRWKDYGSYLGNYADYGNDFGHSKSINFNLGCQVSNEDVSKGIYVVLKKEECFRRKTGGFRPSVEYVESYCEIKDKLSVEDFDKEYTLLKKL